MVGLKTIIGTQRVVIRACSTLIMSEMSRAILSVAADYTISSFPSFLRIVSYWLEALEIDAIGPGLALGEVLADRL